MITLFFFWGLSSGFAFAPVGGVVTQIRYGHLAVLPDMESVTSEKVAQVSKVLQAAKDADVGHSTNGQPVNVLHIALMQVKDIPLKRYRVQCNCNNIKIH